jgi:hypothetical protein
LFFLNRRDMWRCSGSITVKLPGSVPLFQHQYAFNSIIQSLTLLLYLPQGKIFQR